MGPSGAGITTCTGKEAVERADVLLTGKTTFLSLLSGKVDHTRGKIIVNGVEEKDGLKKYRRYQIAFIIVIMACE
jgi:hypothetical protein